MVSLSLLNFFILFLNHVGKVGSQPKRCHWFLVPRSCSRSTTFTDTSFDAFLLDRGMSVSGRAAELPQKVLLAEINFTDRSHLLLILVDQLLRDVISDTSDDYLLRRFFFAPKYVRLFEKRCDGVILGCTRSIRHVLRRGHFLN